MESSFQWTAKTQVDFLKKLPSEARLAEAFGFKPEQVLLIYDKRLKREAVTRAWIEDFPLSYGVTGGESLKDFSAFASHLKRICRLCGPLSPRAFGVVALGGGSVGDFAGFFASVFKRGVPLVHVPSTLLAAMDSAHGGKTALNLGEIKNQIGTFYPARAVLLVRSLFEGLPALQLQSAAGELAKMALLSGGDLFARFKSEFQMSLDSIWEFLPAVIEAKYRIVEKDPFEQSGERQLLNLGHSFGHALESYYQIPHGVAVGQGLIFAILWSGHQGHLREERELLELLTGKTRFLPPPEFRKKHKAMSRSKLARLVREDKKLTDSRHLSFVFLEKAGAPFRKVVTVESLLTETQRQGWTAL